MCFCCNSFPVDTVPTVPFTITAHTQKQGTDLLSIDWLRAAKLGQSRRGILKFSEPTTMSTVDRRRAS